MINILFYSILSSAGAMHPEAVLLLLPSCAIHIPTHEATWSLICHIPPTTSLNIFTIVLFFFLFWWETLNTMLWLLVNTVENLGFFEKNCSGFTTRVSLYRLIVDSHRKEKGYSWLKGYNILSHWVYISRAHKLLAWNFQHFPTIAHRLWWSISQPQTTSWKSFVSFRHNCQKSPLNFAPMIILIHKLSNRPKSLKFLFWIKMVSKLTWHTMCSCHVIKGMI